MTHEMCEKAVDSYLLTLKFVPDWSVRPTIFNTLFSVVCAHFEVKTKIICIF